MKPSTPLAAAPRPHRGTTRLLALALGCVLLAGLGSRAPAADTLSQDGRFIGMDTHRLYLYCTGEGSPTVVMDSGIGGSSLEWMEVQNQLNGRLRTCAYDRAGYGWSDPAPGPRTTEVVAAELREMLARAGERPPYVLVGHSFGGFTARYLAARHAEEVVGLVLVDASHTEQTDLREPEEAATATGPVQFNPVKPVTESDGDALPRSVIEQMSFLNTRRKAIFAQMDELKHFQASAAQVRDAGPLPAVPVVVLSRGQRAWPEGPEGDAEEALWEAKQQDLVGLSPLGVHRYAERSAHNIPVEQPSAVVAAILEVTGTPSAP